MKKTFVVILSLFLIAVFACKKNEPSAPEPAPADTSTPQPTDTVTWDPSVPTYTETETITETPTETGTTTATSSFTETFTDTVTDTFTITETPSGTPTETFTETFTVTETPTATATPTVCSVVAGYYGSHNLTQSGGVLMASSWTLASPTGIDTMAIYLDTPTNFILGIYTDSAGSPGTLVVQSAVTAGSVGWNFVDVPLVSYAPGTIWLVMITEGVGNRAMLFSGNPFRYLLYDWTTATVSGLPANPAGWGTYSDPCDLMLYALNCN